MKKNKSGIILAAEIFAIILFHSHQMKQQAPAPFDSLARNAKVAPQHKMPLHAKPAYIYLPLLK